MAAKSRTRAPPVAPEPARFAATLLNLRICRANDNLAERLPSMEQALETGASRSAAIPFTPAELLAEVPQTYFGPVVLVTNARCYSAADIFAAGFQNNGIGTVLGVFRRSCRVEVYRCRGGVRAESARRPSLFSRSRRVSRGSAIWGSRDTAVAYPATASSTRSA
jgi:hypothetical protein